MTEKLNQEALSENPIPTMQEWLTGYIEDLWDKSPEHYWLSRILAALARAPAPPGDAVHPDASFLTSPSPEHLRRLLAERTRERDEARAQANDWHKAAIDSTHGAEKVQQFARESVQLIDSTWMRRAAAAEARVKELEADIAVRRQDRFDLATKLAAAEARVKALAEAGKGLERAAYEVARYGAQTGARWTKLSSALIQTRAALASSDAAPESKEDAPSDDTPPAKEGV